MRLATRKALSLMSSKRIVRMAGRTRETMEMLLDDLNSLTDHHKAHCKLYADYIDTLFPARSATSLASLPYLPVRAFKQFDLKSITDDQVFKTMTSSGTSGATSRIFLDKETAKLQSSKLIEIFTQTFSKSRFPMLVIDAEATVSNREKFSARTAAINGFTLFSRGREFALRDDMSLDIEKVLAFAHQHRDSRIFLFGFTFVVWQNFIEALRKDNVKLDLSNAFLLHGGGWKKLEAQKISNAIFKAQIREWIGCADVRNYYGMVEQTGTIFMECAEGHLHAADGADVIIRDAETLAVLPHGEEGLIQVFSNIQRSYPGHSLLTEDVGSTEDAASCACGHKGTIVKINGRLKQAEVRGCSDAYHS